MKYRTRLFVALLVLSFPAFLTLVFPGLSGSSNTELRALQDFPGLPTDFSTFRKWPGQFDKFTADRFPFREDIIRVIGKHLYSMGISISPDVFIGSRGWLFLKRDSDVLDESRGIRNLTATEVNEWAKTYKGRREQLQKQGIELLLVLVPNKHTVYPQFMPKWNFPVGRTITDQIVSELHALQTEGVIDLRGTLKEHARSELVYGRYNSHWNDRGAYFGYQEIIKNIPDALQLGEQQIQFEPRRVFGDLSRLIGQVDLTEKSQALNIPRSELPFSFDTPARQMNFYTSGFRTETSLSHLPSALFLCDSFTSDYLYQYLAPSFHKALFVHHKGMEFNQELIASFKPDYVVYIIVERLIPYKLP